MNTQYKVIFGGTFDPFHHGHLTVAKHVAKELALDEVTLLPANIPPHKNAAKLSASHRLAMLKALVADEPLLCVDARELNRDKPSYTIETLIELKNELPATAVNFVIGMDSLLNFTKWYRWQEIIKLTNLIVCTRPDCQLDEKYESLDARLHQYLTPINHLRLTATSQITILPAIAVDISSTQIRQAIKDGETSISSQLPQAIDRYINQHQLYQK